MCIRDRYITVQEDYGGERRYRTNNPFVMQSMDGLWWSSDTIDEEDLSLIHILYSG